MSKPVKYQIAIAQGETIEPLFVRLPKAGEHCPISGLTRGVLNTLILPMRVNNFAPPVKSISLKKPGAKRACRLISYESLRSYLSLF